MDPPATTPEIDAILMMKSRRLLGLVFMLIFEKRNAFNVEI
jgi:hypothetical protein